MLIELKKRLDEPEIQELLAYAVFPDPEMLEQTVQAYREDEGLEIVGMESEDQIIALAGYRVADGVLELRHIAVVPEERGKGYGRGILLELLEFAKPSLIVAETDEEAIDFYRSIGFSVIGLGEKVPEVERFRCTYEAVPEE